MNRPSLDEVYGLLRLSDFRPFRTAGHSPHVCFGTPDSDGSAGFSDSARCGCLRTADCSAGSVAGCSGCFAGFAADCSGCSDSGSDVPLLSPPL